MTLKEKFELVEFSFPSDESVQIADEFAIEFINWYAITGSWIEENLTSRELLEIFKKEKGL